MYVDIYYSVRLCARQCMCYAVITHSERQQVIALYNTVVCMSVLHLRNNCNFAVTEFRCINKYYYHS